MEQTDNAQKDSNPEEKKPAIVSAMLQEKCNEKSVASNNQKILAKISALMPRNNSLTLEEALSKVLAQTFE